MKFGFVVPFSDARLTSELAREAEAAGWDGIFVADLVWGVDAWVQLTAAAMATVSIRLGTMLTPLPWKQPWTVAGAAAALDNLSGGRVILSVGLGAPDAGAAGFGVVTDRKLRAELLDEGLDVLNGLWSDEPFAYDGTHYHVTPTDFRAPARPVQRPRVPTWAVGVWPSKKSMGRALRCDGLIPAVRGEDGARQATPEELTLISRFIAKERPAGAPFDIVIEGETPGSAGVDATVAQWAAAGATWWTETRWSAGHDAGGIAQVRRRLAAGPPRVA